MGQKPSKWAKNGHFWPFLAKMVGRGDFSPEITGRRYPNGVNFGKFFIFIFKNGKFLIFGPIFGVAACDFRGGSSKNRQKLRFWRFCSFFPEVKGVKGTFFSFFRILKSDFFGRPKIGFAFSVFLEKRVYFSSFLWKSALLKKCVFCVGRKHGRRE